MDKVMGVYENFMDFKCYRKQKNREMNAKNKMGNIGINHRIKDMAF